jgi:hypothetical protein
LEELLEAARAKPGPGRDSEVRSLLQLINELREEIVHYQAAFPGTSSLSTIAGLATKGGLPPDFSEQHENDKLRKDFDRVLAAVPAREPIETDRLPE